MAHPNLELIDALNTTALRLKQGNHYAWGNHGSCNCGNLLQTITKLNAKEILERAHTGVGEWTELATEYCGTTSLPVDLLITELQKIGLTPSDIHGLEYLDDKTVLQNLPGGFRWLSRNIREDVIVYFETLAKMLEQQIGRDITLDIKPALELAPFIKNNDAVLK
jgi:hypothetical protein